MARNLSEYQRCLTKLNSYLNLIYSLYCLQGCDSLKTKAHLIHNTAFHLMLDACVMSYRVGVLGWKSGKSGTEVLFST